MQQINYEIWKQGRFTTVKPDDFVRITKGVHAFATANNLRDCLFKS